MYLTPRVVSEQLRLRTKQRCARFMTSESLSSSSSSSSSVFTWRHNNRCAQCFVISRLNRCTRLFCIRFPLHPKSPLYDRRNEIHQSCEIFQAKKSLHVNCVTRFVKSAIS